MVVTLKSELLRKRVVGVLGRHLPARMADDKLLIFFLGDDKLQKVS